MRFREDKELPETGGKFLKLKDKESVVGIFRGDIQEIFVKWEGGSAKEVDEETPGASFRFRINFVVKEGSAYIPKIFEQGVIVYKDLRAINEEYPLEETVIKITRNGSGKSDTTYTLLPLTKTPPTKETLNYLDTLPLLPLTKQDDHGDGSPMPSDSDIPF